MNTLGLVLYLPADQLFAEQVSTILTNEGFIQSDVQEGAIPLFEQIRRAPASKPSVAPVPWCKGLRVQFQVTFPTEQYEQAMREWDAAARTFAFHSAFAELLWREPYYHVKMQTVDIPKSSKSFAKPWENGAYLYLTFSLQESSSVFSESTLVPFPLGEEEEFTIVPAYSPKTVEDALFHVWREFAFSFHLFLMAADLAEDDDSITGDFDLAYRQAAASAWALCHPLRKARERKQLSMQSLAESIGLGRNGQNRVNDWEHGRHIPHRVFANALSEVLGFASGAQVREICQDWQRGHLQSPDGER